MFYQSIDETRLVTYYNKIQSQMSSTMLQSCRQAGLAVNKQLYSLFAYVDWEIRLIREIKAKLALQFSTGTFGRLIAGDQSVPLKLFAAMFETLKGAKDGLMGTIQEKEQEEKKRQIEALKRLLHELVDESEGKFLRYPPLSQIK